MSEKIIPAELAAWQSWQLPEVGADGDPVAGRVDAAHPRSMITAEQIEEIQRQAYEEGFAQGRDDGVADGRREMAGRIERLEQLITALGDPLNVVDEAVEQQLVSLSLAVARQLVRRELKTDGGQVVAAVREALGALPLNASQVRVHLHPEDAALVREALTISEEQNWRIVDDPVMTRGGCKVVSDTSRIDATVEARLHAVAAAVLGGERDEDQPPADA
ncbi:MAG TPA: flagellar assembly protein FliH [Gammaproteobacteria bacterium]|nr:flagellar assembly protein FliH [Gammaproteobacteria bacterium]